jgi:hypothetical protein
VEFEAQCLADPGNALIAADKQKGVSRIEKRDKWPDGVKGNGLNRESRHYNG